MKSVFLFVAFLTFNVFSQNYDPNDIYYEGKLIDYRIEHFSDASSCILTMEPKAGGYTIGLILSITDCEMNMDKIEAAINSKKDVAVAESNTYGVDLGETIFNENFHLVIHDVSQFL